MFPTGLGLKLKTLLINASFASLCFILPISWQADGKKLSVLEAIQTHLSNYQNADTFQSMDEISGLASDLVVNHNFYIMFELFKQLPANEYQAYLNWVNNNQFNLPSPYLKKASLVAYDLGQENKAKTLSFLANLMFVYDVSRCQDKRAFEMSRLGYSLIPNTHELENDVDYDIDMHEIPSSIHKELLTHFDVFKKNPPLYSPMWACGFSPEAIKFKDGRRSKAFIKPITVKVTNLVTPKSKWSEEIEFVEKHLLDDLKRLEASEE